MWRFVDLIILTGIREHGNVGGGGGLSFSIRFRAHKLEGSYLTVQVGTRFILQTGRGATIASASPPRTSAPTSTQVKFVQ
jgi:hypothetical protein